MGSHSAFAIAAVLSLLAVPQGLANSPGLDPGVVGPAPAGSGAFTVSATPSAAPSFVSLALPSTAALPRDEEAVRDFKKYFRKLKDSASRVEAVLTLLDVEEPSIVDVLVPRLGDKDAEVARAAARVLASFKERPPIDRLLLRYEKEKKDHIRLGHLEAMRKGSVASTSSVSGVSIRCDKVKTAHRAARVVCRVRAGRSARPPGCAGFAERLPPLNSAR